MFNDQEGGAMHRIAWSAEFLSVATLLGTFRPTLGEAHEFELHQAVSTAQLLHSAIALRLAIFPIRLARPCGALGDPGRKTSSRSGPQDLRPALTIGRPRWSRRVLTQIYARAL